MVVVSGLAMGLAEVASDKLPAGDHKNVVPASAVACSVVEAPLQMLTFEPAETFLPLNVQFFVIEAVQPVPGSVTDKV